MLKVNEVRKSLNCGSTNNIKGEKRPSYDHRVFNMSNSVEEFSIQNNYKPESQYLSRNNYKTNTHFKPHNRSYQALDPYLNERIRHESNKIIIENNGHSGENGNFTCLSGTQVSNKNKTKLAKCETSYNINDSSLQYVLKKSKQQGSRAQNRKKRTNQLLNYFFKKSMKHNKQLCETFSDIDSIFPMKMTSFSREKMLSRNTKMKHCTPKRSKDAKIFKKASLNKSRATVSRKSRVQYKHFKNADLPRVDARRMTFYKDGDTSNINGDSNHPEIKITKPDVHPYDSKQKTFKRVLNKSYSNCHISRKDKLTKNLKLSGSSVELKSTQKSNMKQKIPRSPYGNFLEIKNNTRCNLSEQKSQKSNARTDKSDSRDGYLSSRRSNDTEDFWAATPNCLSVTRLESSVKTKDATIHQFETKLPSEDLSSLHSKSTVSHEENLLNHSEVYPPILPIRIHLTYKNKSKPPVLPKSPPHNPTSTYNLPVPRHRASRRKSNNKICISKELF
ncbi:unnamed protein product [Moneuplotes crassus]|uniref:Uncharacterized protein n=1 Tax=Euplotes crassus TaxID=5936 RepID=A0AAD1U521_EUPCR|nr:unnamed protein product [Moneuplotes crassus]